MSVVKRPTVQFKPVFANLRSKGGFQLSYKRAFFAIEITLSF